jgi:hypothetical protein
MLIPRPQPGADPDEQTVVTSMPPTPATVIRQHAPSSRDLPLATPLGMSRKDSPKPAVAAIPAPRPVPVAPPPTPLQAEGALRPPHSPGPVDARAKIPPHVNGGAKPAAPSPLAVAVVEPITTPGARPPRPRAAPEAPRTPPPAPRTYDPGADLNQAGVGTGLALVGSMLLAFLFVWDHPALLWIGLAMSLGGGVLTLGILQTGDRGRRPARRAFAAVLGLLFAVAVPSALVGVKWFVAEAREAYAMNFESTAGTAPAEMASGTADPTEAAVTVITAPATPPDPIEEPVVAEPAVAEPEPVAVVAPPPKPKPAARPKPTPKPAPRAAPVATKPAPVAPAAAGVAAVAPAPAPALPATVPIDAVHVMLSSNLEVKRCFVPLVQTGQAPPRVDLKFDIQPSGTASGARVVQSEFRGSELEGCLARTVAGIKFPPTSGNGTSITYPFILQ